MLVTVKLVGGSIRELLFNPDYIIWAKPYYERMLLGEIDNRKPVERKERTEFLLSKGGYDEDMSFIADCSFDEFKSLVSPKEDSDPDKKE